MAGGRLAPRRPSGEPGVELGTSGDLESSSCREVGAEKIRLVFYLMLRRKAHSALRRVPDVDMVDDTRGGNVVQKLVGDLMTDEEREFVVALGEPDHPRGYVDVVAIAHGGDGIVPVELDLDLHAGPGNPAVLVFEPLGRDSKPSGDAGDALGEGVGIRIAPLACLGNRRRNRRRSRWRQPVRSTRVDQENRRQNRDEARVHNVAFRGSQTGLQQTSGFS